MLALACFALAGKEGMFQFKGRKKLKVWLQFTGIRSRGNEHVHPLTLKKTNAGVYQCYYTWPKS